MPETDAAAAIAVAQGDGAELAPVAAVEEQPPEQPPAGGIGSMWPIVKALITRCIVIYCISSLIRGWRGPQEMIKPNATMPDGTTYTGPGSPGSTARTVAPGRNMFDRGIELDVYFYLSEAAVFTEYTDPSKLFWSKKGFVYGDWTSGSNRDGSFEQAGQIECSPSLQNNGSIFLHVVVVHAGNSPDPNSEYYVRRQTMYRTQQLNRYKKKKYQKTANLITGKTEQSDTDIIKAETMKHEILSHWHPNLTISLVDDHTPWSRGALPPPLDEYVHFDPVSGDYYPIFFFNDYWNLNADFILLNDTVKTLNLTLTLAPMSLFKFQLYASQKMKNKWTQMLGTDMVDDSDDDQDTLKQTILETNPYLLAATVIVSLLHTVFELLAFKNDIQFWRSRKSLEGLSVRSVLFNIFTSGVVLLYILDNETNFVVRMSVGIGMLIEFWKIPKVLDIKIDRENKFRRSRKSLEGLSVRSVLFNIITSGVVLLYILDNETNFVVHMSAGIGMLIEFWKIPKVMDIKIDRQNKIMGVLPRLSFKDKGTYVESSTRTYDILAFKYLSWVCFPLLGGYAVYSIIYHEHRGWYSFILSMLYGFLLTFGFIMMTPQLFINYKMKSVAHLPWRMLSYKFLNTFIDDIFAFVIKMPTMYRIGCFRDDIVFLIYCYQRYIYPIDPKRVNEFGTSADMFDENNQLVAPAPIDDAAAGDPVDAVTDRERTRSPSSEAASSNGDVKSSQHDDADDDNQNDSEIRKSTSPASASRSSRASSSRDKQASSEPSVKSGGSSKKGSSDRDSSKSSGAATADESEGSAADEGAAEPEAISGGDGDGAAQNRSDVRQRKKKRAARKE